MIFPCAYYQSENSSYLNICNKSAENLPSFQLDRDDRSYLIHPTHSFLPPPPPPPPPPPYTIPFPFFSQIRDETFGYKMKYEEGLMRRDEEVQERWRRNEEYAVEWRKMEEEALRRKGGRMEEGRKRDGEVNSEIRMEEEGYSPTTMAEDSFFEDLPEEEIFIEKRAFWFVDDEDVELLSEICVILDFNAFLNGLNCKGWKVGATRLREVGIVKKVGEKRQERGRCLVGTEAKVLEGDIETEVGGLIKEENKRKKEKGGKEKQEKKVTIKKGRKKRKLE